MVRLKTLVGDRLWGQILRFVFVGFINTTFSYAVYCLGVYIGVSYWIAGLFALVLGIVVSFFAQGKLVFHTSLKGRFCFFAAAWAAIYFANIGAIRTLAAFGFDYYLAGAIAIFPTVILSFISSRFVVFRGH